MRGATKFAAFGVALLVIAAALGAGWYFYFGAAADEGPIVIGRVTAQGAALKGFPRGEASSLDLEGAFARVVRSDARFRLDEGAAGEESFVAKVRVEQMNEYRESRGGLNGSVTRLVVSVQISGTVSAGFGRGRQAALFTGDAEIEHFEANPEAGTIGRPAPHRQMLDEALRQSLDKLLLSYEARNTSLDRLLADLNSPDARLRDAAVQALADRRDPRAFDALLRALYDPDERVVRHAMGALEQIGDPRALIPIIDASRVTDPAEALRLIELCRRFRGDDAVAFLSVVSSGHARGDVRRAANDVLLEFENEEEREAARASAAANAAGIQGEKGTGEGGTGAGATGTP